MFELLWRDFFSFTALACGPDLFRATGPRGEAISWRQDDAAFARWRDGRTGIPFVDANMRELTQTGYMSNRGRQNVASFLSGWLGLDWRLGAAWFEHTLLDHDVGSNWGNWAWNSGVGFDPRQRMFDVLGQAARYDPQGEYVRTWIPELAGLDSAVIHTPWHLSAHARRNHGAGDYPPPMIDVEADIRPPWSED
ncbi:MAG: FAD-binding domain-containing protein [Trueperaceae bacterium]|nr:FAD-binding domain-containing protein [Trueperaceae bacterium]